MYRTSFKDDFKHNFLIYTLKVVCNEKEGGPGRGQTFAIGLGAWRLRYVCLLILLSSLISMYFRFCCVKHNF